MCWSVQHFTLDEKTRCDSGHVLREELPERLHPKRLGRQGQCGWRPGSAHTVLVTCPSKAEVGGSIPSSRSTKHRRGISSVVRALKKPMRLCAVELLGALEKLLETCCASGYVQELHGKYPQGYVVRFHSPLHRFATAVAVCRSDAVNHYPRFRVPNRRWRKPGLLRFSLAVTDRGYMILFRGNPAPSTTERLHFFYGGREPQGSAKSEPRSTYSQ